MSFLEIFVLALALAADAFSVGAAAGLRHRQGRQVFRLAFHFGLFQALMPLVGALAGTVLLRWVEAWDHWLVFAILAVLGGRMILGGLQSAQEQRHPEDLTRGVRLIGLSVAVSIDALAAGIGLAAAQAPIALSVTIIGLVAAAATAIAMRAASHLPKSTGPVSEVAAGVVLVLLGTKTVLEHLGYLRLPL